ncbi:DUF4136 domain-containing protein [Coraliomargarita akajimensis]|uniref:DUF4136 domain-containing protein n=1 Tax=Coraliomargarita akajimensis (strain DSM 45221 / IAM 15411 / JCM 23193 / KCTC 12865 / 04OKA010-24) TaxID=583355 RepID=D5EI99_CORAD|nr:DUF4136 domain-containing protein [Coraliomargarita akajimensis]ADE54165.1 hypothetical protein Caka_1144 [Coraliomargarita akajimensis DSM 45221]
MKNFFALGCAFLVLVVGGLTGCQTKDSGRSEFVKTVEFSALDTFNYKHTLSSGMEWADSQRLMLEALSEEILCEELVARGFEQVPEAGDFEAVVKWRKASTSHATGFEHIDGPRSPRYRRMNDPVNRVAMARIHLVIELYDRESGNLFWRKELPNVFDAIELTEDRITRALQLGIKNFPDRIIKDPNLKSFN